ncbi:F5/8 type C domain-containing protein [Jiangella alkaliphila]|uniref:F5/8 type C domain-containing protein n=1 Tax=Jiangella alkaliphila TaxID=419479 RepID=A0A1H2J612_9ACTN|nr:F5/8 type C domain-containing protein [Jiangella alkaliphila]
MLRPGKPLAALLSAALAIAAVVLAYAPADAAPPDRTGPAQTAERWITTELALQSTQSYPNPFLDVEVMATFAGPGGEVIRRPGFWDGGDTWKVRFAPPTVGTWTYQIASSDPDNSGLRRTGTIQAVPYTGDQEIYQRGFLTAGDGGRQLAYADGTPFFWLGDTHWFFDRKESWDTSNKPGVDSQFRSMVDRRAEQRFTVYQSVVFGPESSYWRDGRQGVEIDPAYFRDQLDRKMAYVADAGLVNAFGVGFHSNIDGFVEGEQRLAEYVVARYGAYPMVWTTAGEGAGYDVGTREARIDGWRDVARTIHQYDDYDHPQTAHTTALTEKQTFGLPQYYEGEGWFDFEMLQGGHRKVVPTGDYDYYAEQYGAPFFESEANYEQILDGFATDTVVRQSAYRSIQAGGFGYGYGAHGIWNAAWDDQDTADDYGYGHRNWFDAIDFPGGDQMTHLADFYRSLPLSTMSYRPDGWAVWDGEYSAELTDPTLRADDAANVVTVYFLADTSSRGALVLPDAAYEAQWYDPRTGEYQLIDDSLTPVAGRWTVPEKPTGADWLLLVRKLQPTALPAAGATASAGLTVVSDGAVVTRLGERRPRALQVDLGEPYELARVGLDFPAGLLRHQYLLEGSVDGQTWTTLQDHTGAPVFGAEQTERVSGTARHLRLTLSGPSRVALVNGSDVTVTAYAKVGTAATVRSTAYLVGDRERTIGGVTNGTDRAALLAALTPTVGASTKVWLADGTTEVTSGGIEDGMLLSVTSQDGLRTRFYTIDTVADLGENLALTAVATASSVESTNYSPAAVNDGNNSTETWSGWAAVVFPAWLELDFGRDRTFDRVEVYTKKDYEQKGYTLQYWDGAGWVDLVTVTGNTTDHLTHTFAPSRRRGYGSGRRRATSSRTVRRPARRWPASARSRCTCRLPDDQLRPEHDLLVAVLGLQLVQQEPRGGLAQRVLGHGDRGERHDRQLSGDDVVEPDDGDVAGHLDALAQQPVHHRQRQAVARTEGRRRPRVEGEDLVGQRDAVADGRARRVDAPQRLRIEPRVAQRRLGAGEAVLDLVLAAGAAEEDEVAVAELDQVRGGEPAALVVVEGDRARVVVPVAQHDHPGPGGAQRPERQVAPLERRHDDRAGDAHLGERGDVAALVLARALGVARDDDQPVLARDVLDAPSDLDEERVRRVGHDVADGGCAGAAHHLDGPVRHELEVGDGLLDALAGGRGDRLDVVEVVGHRPDRDGGGLRDVSDGGTSGHVGPRSSLGLRITTP